MSTNCAHDNKKNSMAEMNYDITGTLFKKTLDDQRSKDSEHLEYTTVIKEEFEMIGRKIQAAQKEIKYSQK